MKTYWLWKFHDSAVDSKFLEENWKNCSDKKDDLSETKIEDILSVHYCFH